MFARTVALVQIAAIIACPLWCANGLCDAGPCCSAKQSSQPPCSIHGTANCCCRKPSPDSSDRRDSQVPGRCPENSLCQGVCGGAVIEKPCELDSFEDSFFLPFVDAEASVSSRLVHSRSYDVEHTHCLSGGNHGRSLRALYMSFLC